MEDKTLLNISLSVIAIGMIVLLLMSYYDAIPEKSFSDITSSDVGSKVKTTGIVKQIYMHNNSMTLKVKQECLMDVMIFDKDQNFTIGETITVQGTVQEYNGKQEILAEKISK